MECKAIQDEFNTGAEIHSQSLYRLAIIELTAGSMNRNLGSSLFYLSLSSSSYITNYLIANLPTLLLFLYFLSNSIFLFIKHI